MTKEQFLDNITPWGSHRTLLWEALELTRDSKLPVIELGSGPGSTPFLRQYCTDNNRPFVTYETSKVWATAMKSVLVTSWDSEKLWDDQYSVCLIDMAPGEYRKVALKKIKSEIIVIHDSEPPGWNASDYRVRPLFDQFKYKLDERSIQKGGPWTTMLSNTIKL